MIGALYPRNRIASVLLKSGLPDCYRIMLTGHPDLPDIVERHGIELVR